MTAQARAIHGKSRSASGPETADGVRRTVVRLPRERRVRDIEAAARAAFGENGYAGTAVSDIAARAGVSEGTVFTFFPTKRDLVIRVVELWYEAMILTFDEMLPGIRGSSNKMRFFIRQHLKSLHDSPKLARLCSNEVRNEGDYYQGPLYELNRRYTHIFIDIFRTGVASGEFRRGVSAGLVRDLIFGGIDHHISGFLYGRAKLDVDRSTDEFMNVLHAIAGCDEGLAPGPDRLESVIARLEVVADKFERGGERPR
jgi:AcrR family transcriptional regulator